MSSNEILPNQHTVTSTRRGGGWDLLGSEISVLFRRRRT